MPDVRIDLSDRGNDTVVTIEGLLFQNVLNDTNIVDLVILQVFCPPRITIRTQPACGK